MKIPKQPGHSNSGVIGQHAAGNLASNSMDRTASEQVDMLVTAGEGILGRLLRGPTPGKYFSYFLLIPALIAFGISCYLAYAALTASPVAGCGGGQLFDCNHVLHSKYSKWMGMPVSLLAAANYLAMLVALSTICFSGVPGLARKISWIVVAFCGIAAGMAAIWFIGLQALVIGHFCPWCLGAHSCGLVIAIAIFWKQPFGIRQTLACSGVAAVGISALVFGQVLAEEPVKYKIIEHGPVSSEAPDSDGGLFSAPKSEDGQPFSPPKEEDGSLFEVPTDAAVGRRSSGFLAASLLSLFSNTSLVTYSGSSQEETKAEGSGDKVQQEPEEPRTISIQGNLKLNPKQWPILGSPDAKHIFVEMFDYACPHCRATHTAIKGACNIMGEDLAVIVLPVPLNSNCNNAVTRTGANFVQSCEMAKLAVACWRVDPEKFDEFHHWMFEGGACPSYATAKAKADQLVGREKLDEELRKEAVGKYISKHVELYKHAGRGIVPKLLFPTTTVEGEYTSASSLVNLIKDRAK